MPMMWRLLQNHEKDGCFYMTLTRVPRDKNTSPVLPENKEKMNDKNISGLQIQSSLLSSF